MVLLVISWLLFTTFAGNIYCQNPSWNCEFHEEARSVSLNFSKLYNNSQDYVIHHEDKNETLRVQLCGPLKKNCNGMEDYGVCLQNGTREIGLGRVPERMHEDGRIIFKYTGDKCRDDINYSVNIIMKCDNSAEYSYPELFPYKEESCAFFILWRTILACANDVNHPVSPVTCKVNDKHGNYYDLSSLTELAENYIVPIDDNTSIILNVCHPVIYTYGAVCSENAGACLRNRTGTISYKDIGTVSSLQLDGNSLVLDYKYGAVCQSGTHIQTNISFICDYNKTNNTTPELTDVDENCHYKLTWKTAAACSMKDLEERSRQTAAPCKITNPITNIEYNLNSLKGEDRIVKTKNGTEYKFSICGRLLSKFCQSNTDDMKAEAGVCSGFNHEIGGRANSRLLWSMTGPYLNYSDGSPCDNNRYRSTTIKFICASNGSNNTDFIDDDNPCNLHIYYHTQLVCDKKNILCGIGLELQENGLCANRSLVQSLSSPIQPTKINAVTNQNSIKRYSDITIVIILFGVCVIFSALYLLNSERREYLRSRCCSWHFRNPDVRMQYSRINSVEETAALLDAPDTHCQSDSDDDLLRI